jgi:hypothetical protein
MNYIVLNGAVVAMFKNLQLAQKMAEIRGGTVVASNFTFKKPIVTQNPDGSYRIREGWTPPAAERIAFLNSLKAQLLDRTTALKLPPETVMQLALELQKFSLLADIGADETLYFSLQQLPADHPVINGEIKEWLLSALRAYIISYKNELD